MTTVIKTAACFVKTIAVNTLQASAPLVVREDTWEVIAIKVRLKKRFTF